MKKYLSIIAMALMALACNQEKGQKVLVLYYSQTGNTRAVAQEIGDRLGADVEELLLVQPYSGTFEETIERCLKEREMGELPEIRPLGVDVSAYDVIFLGYPVWFGTYAPPVASFLNSVDLSGKEIVPFCTFGSGGLDSSSKDLVGKEPGCVVLPGYGVRAARIDAMPGEVDRFLKESGFLDGEYERYEDFGPSHPVSEDESGIFDAAVGDYPMMKAKAEEVSSRAVSGGTEYLFVAKDLPREPEGEPHLIRVQVLCLDGQPPVFTQVMR